jgi:outer membrane protein OmpA-like peptidoglycan-associated protein
MIAAWQSGRSPATARALAPVIATTAHHNPAWQRLTLARRHVQHTAGAGAPLPAGARARLEHSYHTDLGAVRVHADEAAARAAAALHAHAFTVGRTIWFGGGRYRPGTPAGLHLLAHEVAHTLQSPAAPAAPSGSPARLQVGARDDPAESAAERAAAALAADRPAPAVTTSHTTGVVRRTPLDTADDTARGAELWSLMARGRLVIAGFAHNEATLDATHEQDLDGHAVTLLELLEEDPGGLIMVTGHTDATGTAQRNATLGAERAGAVRDRLVAAGVPADRVRAESAGANQLAVDTTAPEPANRRADVAFLPSLRLPRTPGVLPPTLGVGPLQTTPPLGQPGTGQAPSLEPPFRADMCTIMPGLCAGGPGPRLPSAEEIMRPVPPPPRTSDGLRSFFERDPLLRLLPPALRGRAIDGLMRADEAAVGALLGQVDLDGTQRRALDALLRALLRYMKGERWTPPVAPPPSRLPPGAGPTPFPRAPGERIFMLPPLRF